MTFSSIDVAVVMLLPGCNMVCNFCITEDSFSAMSFAQAKMLLGSLKARGIRNIVLGGGEPTHWPYDVFKLAAHAKTEGFFVQLGTNGINLPESDFGKSSIDRYVLPLESTEAHTHNQMRRYQQQHHAVILHRLDKFQETAQSVTVSTVVTQINRAHLPRLASFLQDYQEGGGNLHAWHLYRFIPEGRGGRAHQEELFISRPHYNRACEVVKSSAPSLTIYKRGNMFESRSVGFYWYEKDALKALEPSSARAHPALSQDTELHHP